MVLSALQASGGFGDVAIRGSRPTAVDEAFSAGELRHHVRETLQAETLDPRVPGVGKVCEWFDAMFVNVADNVVCIDRV